MKNASGERLEGVSIERPCPKRWSELAGDGTRRFCSECALHVTNLSALTRTEAEGFLAAGRGRVCVTYVPGESGGVRVRAEPGTRIVRALAHAASFLLGLVFLLPGCRPAEEEAPAGPRDPDDTRSDPGRLMGKVRADPEVQVGDDELMILGEITLPEPELPPAAPGDEPSEARDR